MLRHILLDRPLSCDKRQNVKAEAHRAWYENKGVSADIRTCSELLGVKKFPGCPNVGSDTGFADTGFAVPAYLGNLHFV
jgi:hypothetical protein